MISPKLFTASLESTFWKTECEKVGVNIEQFKYYLDKNLQELNSDYEAKRFKNILIKKPILHIAKNNFFYQILKKQNKIGGQNKIKRLHNDRNFIEFLLNNL